jgi:hypothetical protein
MAFRTLDVLHASCLSYNAPHLGVVNYATQRAPFYTCPQAAWQRLEEQSR